MEAPITLKKWLKTGTRQHTSHDENCKNNFLDCRIRVNGRKRNKRDGKRGQHTVSTVYTPKFIRQNISVFKFFHLGQRFGFLPFWCTTFTFCSAYRVNEPWIRKDFVAFSPPALSCKRSLRHERCRKPALWNLLYRGVNVRRLGVQYYGQSLQTNCWRKYQSPFCSKEIENFPLVLRAFNNVLATEC